MRQPKPDVEELAKKAREKRENDCNADLNKLLENRNCQMSVVVQIGNSLVPINAILTLPISILISSK